MRSGLDAGATQAVCQTAMAKKGAPPAPPNEKPKDRRRNVVLNPAQIEQVARWALEEDRSLSAMGRRLMDAGFDLYELWLAKPLLTRVRRCAEEEQRPFGEMLAVLIQAGLDARDLKKSQR